MASPPGAGGLPRLRLRPPRDAGAVPGVRYNPGVKRIRRVLLHAVTVMSLVLCVAPSRNRGVHAPA